MKNYLIVSLIMMFFAGTVHAVDFRGDNVVVVDESVNEMLMAAGSEVSVTSPVDGDVFLAGQNVVVSAAISEDAWIAGNVITINGAIEDDLRAAGNVLTLAGAVKGDIQAGGNTISINSPVGGNLSVGGNTISLNSTVGGNADLGGENVTINNVIAGNVNLEAARLSFGPEGSIGGDLTIYGDGELPENLSGFVQGNIGYEASKHADIEFGGEWSHEGESRDGFHFNFFKFLSLIILGALMLWKLPNSVRTTAATVQKDWGKTLMYGIGALILIPVIALILLATGVGASVGGFLLANYSFLWIFMGLFAIVTFADLLVETWLHPHIGQGLWSKIGVMVVLAALLTLLPYPVTIVLGLFAIGARLIQKMKYMKEQA